MKEFIFDKVRLAIWVMLDVYGSEVVTVSIDYVGMILDIIK